MVIERKCIADAIDGQPNAFGCGEFADRCKGIGEIHQQIDNLFLTWDFLVIEKDVLVGQTDRAEEQIVVVERAFQNGALNRDVICILADAETALGKPARIKGTQQNDQTAPDIEIGFVEPFGGKIELALVF